MSGRFSIKQGHLAHILKLPEANILCDVQISPRNHVAVTLNAPDKLREDMKWLANKFNAKLSQLALQQMLQKGCREVRTTSPSAQVVLFPAEGLWG